MCARVRVVADNRVMKERERKKERPKTQIDGQKERRPKTRKKRSKFAHKKAQ